MISGPSLAHVCVALLLAAPLSHALSVGKPEQVPLSLGEIYPTPRTASYENREVPLAHVLLIPGEGLNSESPPVQALVERLRNHGGEVQIAETLPSEGSTPAILLGESEATRRLAPELAPPNQKEGYLIRNLEAGARPCFILRGADRAGEMWAVASFNQLIRSGEEGPCVRVAAVDDYPEWPLRGVKINAAAFNARTDYFTPTVVSRFLTGFKSNWIYYGFSLNGGRFRDAWRLPVDDAWRGEFESVSRWLTPIGSRWTVAFTPVKGEAIRTSDPADLAHLAAYADVLYPLGGELGIHFDDDRIPLPPADKAAFGTAREADVFFLQKLEAHIRERFGARRLVFCPPFYWGPSGKNPYDESRDAYLETLGREIPPNVDIFWSGGRVKFSPLDPQEVRWITRKLQRKPLLWANLMGPHNRRYHIGDEITNLQQIGYDRVADDLSGYLWNSNDLVGILTLLDYLWNPAAYDPATSSRRAAQMLVGKEAYNHLVEAGKALAEIDIYGGRVSPAAAKDVEKITRQIATAEAAYQQALKASPEAVPLWVNTAETLDRNRKFLARLKANPRLNEADAGLSLAERKRAQEEAGFNEKGSLFLSPFDFTGGANVKVYGVDCSPRLATWVYGSGSDHSALRTTFECDPFPPEQAYALILSAQDGGLSGKCAIRITLNGHPLFEGPSPFAAKGWSQHTLPIPIEKLLRHNTLVIENREPSAARSAPFFMLNYAVIHREAP